MNLLVAMIIGLTLGAATGLWFRRNGDYMLIDLLVGLVGAIVGLALVFFTHATEDFGLFSGLGILGSAIGAGLCLLLFQTILRIPKKKKGSVEHS